MSTTVETATDIRPFHVDFSDEQITELRSRITTARWPTREVVSDASQGVQTGCSRSWRGTGRTTTTSAALRRG